MDCPDCLKPRADGHYCVPSYTVQKRLLRNKAQTDVKARTKYIDTIVAEMRLTMERPRWQPETSQQMKDRAHARAYIRSQVLLTGGEVKDEWQ